ncbi:hypothetical protein KEM55_006309, partial [Ascosphaera atra]
MFESWVSMSFSDKIKLRNERTALLHADPHNPLRHLERGFVHFELGFPDLAAADAYRALTLFDAVVDPESSEYEAVRKLDLTKDLARLSLSGSSPSDTDSNADSEEEDENVEPVTKDEYDQNIRDVYILLVTSLVQCRCMRDAYDFCSQALALPECASPETGDYEIFEIQRNIIKSSMRSRKGRKGSGAGCDDQGIDPSRLDAQGLARRVMYPWNEHEPDRESSETLDLLNKRLKEVAPKCEVRTVALPALHDASENKKKEVSIQLGVVATEDIAPGEILL